MLLTIADANALIARGAPLIIAGSRESLSALAPGPWIGGSIPYFMDRDGGRCDRTRVFVDEIALPVARWRVQAYSSETLKGIASDAFANGFSYVIIPANGATHLEYAMHAPRYPDIFMKPVIGWISGVHLDDREVEKPIVVDGRTGTVLSNEAIVLHVELPAESQVMVHTVNLFEPGSGPSLRFIETGFSASTVLVNGQAVNIARYMIDHGWDARVPLVADYAGTNVNVSVRSIDEAAGRVDFYAPVFPDIDYRAAAPVGNYVEMFAKHVPAGVRPVLSCNCILNYVYGGLEGKRTGPFTGPVTFGEIAHQLVNQTLVYLAA